MKRRRRWFIALSLALLAACVGVWKWKRAPQAPEFLRQYDFTLVHRRVIGPIPDPPGRDLVAGYAYYAIREDPGKVLAALARSVGTVDLYYQGKMGPNVAGVLPEGKCSLFPGRVVLKATTSGRDRGDGWTTILVEESGQVSRFDSGVSRIIKQWIEWRYGGSRTNESDYIFLPDMTRSFYKELLKLRPDALIPWSNVEREEANERRRRSAKP
jgi:hypothetical protein